MTQGLEHVQELEIVRWDVVSYDNITKNPMIYVKPTEKFLTSARDSEFLFRCVVSDSGSRYDNVAVVGVVRPSAVVPNCRPQFLCSNRALHNHSTHSVAWLSGTYGTRKLNITQN